MMKYVYKLSHGIMYILWILVFIEILLHKISVIIFGTFILIVNVQNTIDKYLEEYIQVTEAQLELLGECASKYQIPGTMYIKRKALIEC